MNSVNSKYEKGLNVFIGKGVGRKISRMGYGKKTEK